MGIGLKTFMSKIMNKKNILKFFLILSICVIPHLDGETLPTWTELIDQDSIGSPSPRSLACMAFDSDHERIILFGGLTANGTVNDTWQCVNSNGVSTWSRLNTLHTPSRRAGAMMVFSPRTSEEPSQMILFGGSSTGVGSSLNNETWSLNLDEQNPDWIKINYSSLTPLTRRAYGTMTFDSAKTSGQIILFGGLNDQGTILNETWSFDVKTQTWTQLNLQNASGLPLPRYFASMAYDPIIQKTVLFGGTNGSAFADTWTYSGVSNKWAKVKPSVSPVARYNASMAFESLSSTTGNIILFGGLNADNKLLNDTWSFDGTSWKNLIADGEANPPAREAASMTNDTNDILILFGGQGQNAILNDTWGFTQNPSTPATPTNATVTEQAIIIDVPVASKKQLNLAKFVNLIRWKKPKGNPNHIVAYRIFRNKKLQNPIAEISSHQRLRFKDRNRKPCKIYKYYIVSVDRFGNMSKPAFVKSKGKYCPDLNKDCTDMN